METQVETLDIAGIMQQLPHRYPFLLLDRVLSLVPGKRIVALKNVTINEPFFQGHFPGTPVMPGVMIIEAMAQAACVLSLRTVAPTQPGQIIYFAGIDNARFKRPVVPGDQLTFEVDLVRIARGVGKFSGRAMVGDALAAEADLIAARRDAG